MDKPLGSLSTRLPNENHSLKSKSFPGGLISSENGVSRPSKNRLEQKLNPMDAFGTGYTLKLSVSTSEWLLSKMEKLSSTPFPSETLNPKNHEI